MVFTDACDPPLFGSCLDWYDDHEWFDEYDGLGECKQCASDGVEPASGRNFICTRCIADKRECQICQHGEIMYGF